MPRGISTRELVMFMLQVTLSCRGGSRVEPPFQLLIDLELKL